MSQIDHLNELLRNLPEDTWFPLDEGEISTEIWDAFMHFIAHGAFKGLPRYMMGAAQGYCDKKGIDWRNR